MEDLMRKRAAVIGNIVLPYLKDGMKVLDYGYGNMSIPEYLRTKIKVHFVGVDVIEYPCGDFEFIKIDQGQALPFNDNEFDVTLAGFTLHHTDDPNYYFKELVRVSKSNVLLLEDSYTHYLGRLRTNFLDRLMNLNYFTKTMGGKDMNIPYNFKSHKEWKSLFEENHVKLKELRRIYAYPVKFIPGHNILIDVEV